MQFRALKLSPAPGKGPCEMVFYSKYMLYELWHPSLQGAPTIIFSQTDTMEANAGVFSSTFFPKKEGKYVTNSRHKEGKAQSVFFLRELFLII